MIFKIGYLAFLVLHIIRLLADSEYMDSFYGIAAGVIITAVLICQLTGVTQWI